MITGFVCVILLSASMNIFPRAIFSRYSAITLVLSSSISSVKRSDSSISDLFPSEKNVENHIFLSARTSVIATAIAPRLRDDSDISSVKKLASKTEIERRMSIAITKTVWSKNPNVVFFCNSNQTIFSFFVSYLLESCCDDDSFFDSEFSSLFK